LQIACCQTFFYAGVNKIGDAGAKALACLLMAYPLLEKLYIPGIWMFLKCWSGWFVLEFPIFINSVWTNHKTIGTIVS